MENTKYKLKNGVLLRSLNFPDALTNANLTDELAEKILSEDPQKINLFAQVPEKWNDNPFAVRNSRSRLPIFSLIFIMKILKCKITAL